MDTQTASCAISAVLAAGTFATIGIAAHAWVSRRKRQAQLDEWLHERREMPKPSNTEALANHEFDTWTGAGERNTQILQARARLWAAGILSVIQSPALATIAITCLERGWTHGSI